MNAPVRNRARVDTSVQPYKRHRHTSGLKPASIGCGLRGKLNHQEDDHRANYLIVGLIAIGLRSVGKATQRR
jgi:hypothetical protein